MTLFCVWSVSLATVEDDLTSSATVVRVEFPVGSGLSVGLREAAPD